MAHSDFEHQEQAALIQWADCSPNPVLPGMIGDYLYAVPNGSNKSMAARMKFKREGLRPGVPDLVLAIPLMQHSWPGLYIEMKKQRQHYRGMAEAENAVSETQKLWHDRLTIAGYLVHTCYGWEEARKIIEQYLNHGR